MDAPPPEPSTPTPRTPGSNPEPEDVAQPLRAEEGRGPSIDLWTFAGDPRLAIRAERARELSRVLTGDACWEREMQAAGAASAPDDGLIEHLLGVWFHTDALREHLAGIASLHAGVRRHAEYLVDLIAVDQTVHAPARRALFDELASLYLIEDTGREGLIPARAGQVLARIAAADPRRRDLPPLISVTFAPIATACLKAPRVAIDWKAIPWATADRLRSQLRRG